MIGDDTPDIDPLSEEELSVELAKIIHEWLEMDESTEEK
jgi:hypothetical protein